MAGYDFNQGVDYDALLKTFITTGFQATNFGLAVEEIERMVRIKGVLDCLLFACRRYILSDKRCRHYGP